jgi:hypothetical protein
LPGDLQAQLKTVFLANANDGDFKFELDPFNDGFPVDTYSARALIERFPIEDVVATRVETKNSTDDTVIAEGNENTEQQAEAVQNIARLRLELSKIEVDIDAELERAGIDLEAEGGVVAFTHFLDQHAARYLDAAKSRSPGSFVAVYDAIEPLAVQSPNLAALLQSYERDYQLSRDLLRTPDRNLGDIQDAEMAL